MQRPISADEHYALAKMALRRVAVQGEACKALGGRGMIATAGAPLRRGSVVRLRGQPPDAPLMVVTDVGTRAAAEGEPATEVVRVCWFGPGKDFCRDELPPECLALVG